MANGPWEEFSGSASDRPQTGSQKPWEDFGGTTEPESKGFLGHARDTALSLAKGIVAVPEAAVGLADIGSFGEVGKFLENKDGAIGFRPKATRAYLDSLKTDQAKAQEQQFQDADGLIEKTKVAVQNPSLISNAVAESVPAIGAGGVVGRGVVAAVPRLAPEIAAAVGEGVVGGGQAAEQIRQETATGELSGKQAGMAAASGATTALFGMAGNKLASKLGIGDADTLLTTGLKGLSQANAKQVAKSVPREMLEGAISEGLLEELPQSVSEQIWQNLATDKPWHDDLDSSVVMGVLSGGVMGAGAAPLHRAAGHGEVPATAAPQGEQQQIPAQPVGLLPAPAVTVDANGNAMTAEARNAALQERNDRIASGDITDVTPVPVQPNIEQAAPLSLPAPSIQADAEGNATTPEQRNAAAIADREAMIERSRRIAAGDVTDVTPVPAAPNIEQAPLLGLPAPTINVDSQGNAETGSDRNAAALAQQQSLIERSRRVAAGDILDVTPVPAAPPRPLTPAALSLLAAADQGKAPVVMTRAVRSVASENGIETPKGMKPADVIGALRQKAAEQAATAPAPAQVQRSSERMGLNPAAGPLSAAAVTAVDSGAHAATLAAAQLEAAAAQQRDGATAQMSIAGSPQPSIAATAQLRNGESISTPQQGAVHGTQAPQAQQTDAQPAQAGAAPAGAANPALPVAGTSGVVNVPPTPHDTAGEGRTSGKAQGSATAARAAAGQQTVAPAAADALSAAGAAWSGMSPAQRTEAAGKSGLPKIIRQNVHRSDWAGMNAAVQQKLADVIAPQEKVVEPVSTSTPEQMPAAPVDVEAHAAATSEQNDLPAPSEAQRKAGNYQKGHIKVSGLDISVENPAGSTRTGTDASGKAWSNTMAGHYGYIRGTIGRDKDHVDAFVKPGTPSDHAGPVFVIDQKKPGNGHFDEHKVMIGYASEAEARDAYQRSYTAGWDGIRAVTQMSTPDFRQWIAEGDHTQPAARPDSGSAPLFSRASAALPDTVSVNGTDRPTTNSAGRSIAATLEGVKNFWRWFDAAGREESRGHDLAGVGSLRQEGRSGSFATAGSAPLENADGRVEESRSGDKSAPEGSGGADNRSGSVRSGVDQSGEVDLSRYVLDDSGRPRVFFHGTKDDFSAFDLQHANRKDFGWLGRGVYLTSSEYLADTYASQKRGGASQNVMPLYAAVRNPKVVSDELKRTLSRASQAQIDAWTSQAKAEGHDGVALEFRDGTIELVAFDPTQVKSATGNAGTFDSGNPDVRLAGEGQNDAGRRAAEKLLGRVESQSTVADVARELFGKVGEIRSAQIRVVQSTLDLPPEYRRQVYSAGALTDTQGAYFPETGDVFLVADHIPRGQAYAYLMHEVGVHKGMAGLIGRDGMAELTAQIKRWAEDRSAGDHARLARKALARIPEDTTESHRDEELIAYFVTEAVKAGYGEPKPGDAGKPINRWFARLWQMVKDAIAKLGANPESLTVEDVVALARGALEREIGNADRVTDRGVAQFYPAPSTAKGPAFESARYRLDPSFEITRKDGDFDRGGFAEHGLMGHFAHAADGARTYGFRIIDEGRSVGSVVADVKDGRIVTIHDIELSDKMAGKGREIVAGLSAAGPVKVVDILDQAEGFWRRMGAERDWEGNGQATWESSGQRADREPGSNARKNSGNATEPRSDRLDEAQAGGALGQSERDWLANFLQDEEPVGFFASRAPAAEQGAAMAEQILRGAQAVMQPSSKTLGFLKNIHTQLHKAITVPELGRVYGHVERWAQQATRSIHNASSLAPDILREYGSASDAFKSLKSAWNNSELMPRVWKMLEAGTLAGSTVLDGKRLTHAELRQQFSATDRELALVDQARAAIDAALDESAASVAWRVAGGVLPAAVQQRLTASPGRAEFILRDALEVAIGEAADAGDRAAADKVQNVAKAVAGIFQRTADLKEAGYVPLMRFGKFALTVFNKDGSTAYFARYDTELQMKLARGEIRKNLQAGQRIEVGPVNQDAARLYQGINPEAVALFIDKLGDLEGLDLPPELVEEARQEWLKRAAGDRSAMARAIHRKGIPGFSTDLERVLSNFVTSTGRLAARNYHNADIMQAIQDIPRHMGDVQEDAQKLKEYLDNPNDPWSSARGLMFAWYMGGSAASALVNLTQPAMMSFPFLSQFGAKRAAAALGGSVKAAMGKDTNLSDALREALRRASDEGHVDPNEVHNVFAAGMDSVFKRMPGGTRAQATAKALSATWGSMFAMAESFNRRVTFLAAFKMAQEDSSILKDGQDAYTFAVDAVKQTQGVMEKHNRPNWARGTGSFGVVGAAAFTFKQYSIAYTELLSRLLTAKNADGSRNWESVRAGGIMLGTLILASGLSGIPGADDLDDLIDTVLQAMGFNGNMKRAKREYFASLVGRDMAEVLLYGLSAVSPVDVQARMGLGNMLPATGILKASNRDRRAEQLGEIFGAPGSMVSIPVEAWDALQSGRPFDLLGAMAPLAIRNGAKALDMVSSGQYRDMAGRNVAEVSNADAAWKAVGFQPNSVAQGSRVTQSVRQDVARVAAIKKDVADMYARGVFDNDDGMKQKAQDMMQEWNRNNPEARIALDVRAVAARVRLMRMEREARTVKQVPKSMRASVAGQMEGL